MKITEYFVFKLDFFRSTSGYHRIHKHITFSRSGVC